MSLNQPLMVWKAATNPNGINDQSPLNKYGIQFVKSYLDWYTNSINTTKMPRVSTNARTTILAS